jgi:hypothetical protein
MADLDDVQGIVEKFGSDGDLETAIKSFEEALGGTLKHPLTRGSQKIYSEQKDHRSLFAKSILAYSSCTEGTSEYASLFSDLKERGYDATFHEPYLLGKMQERSRQIEEAREGLEKTHSGVEELVREFGDPNSS